MLANRSAFLKVPHMAALAFFSEDNQRRMEHFLLDLCKVDDISDALEKDKYNAAYGREKIIHITLNEIYSLHEMFVTHCDEVVSLYPSKKKQKKNIVSLTCIRFIHTQI